PREALPGPRGTTLQVNKEVSKFAELSSSSAVLRIRILDSVPLDPGWKDQAPGSEMRILVLTFQIIFPRFGQKIL
ncbi:MAG: hypothetical protein ACK56I_32135, partial [bacterium]